MVERFKKLFTHVFIFIQWIDRSIFDLAYIVPISHLEQSIKMLKLLTILSTPLLPYSRNFNRCTTYEFPKFPILG